ncbi:DUF5689 domain-containing protein [Flavobacterium sp.]|uniref:DUF5689 domain-containing protein n=1 Tax=Flavobacterium sp. TaxID=239 RepID=UPI00286CCD5F|nr:DUF5689 domain-containing protein [Flavobacterium sp.]
MKNLIKNLICLTLIATLISGCVNDTFDTPVQDTCISPVITKNKEVADIYAIATNATATYTADDVVEAYVISSDEGGNFYKSMYFQPVDGSKGFNLSLDEVNAYTKNLQPGKKVFLKLKGLAYANPTSFGRGLIFGAPPTDIFAVDRLSGLVYKNNLIPSCDVVSEDAIVHKITLAQVGDAYLNTLVEFDNVQFTDEAAGGTFDSNRNDDFDSSVFITNGTNTLTVRTSRFANFAGYKVATGKGKIRGVLARYNSTYQIVLRTERDVNMPNPRVDYNLPLVGTNLQYLGAFTETFESFAITSSGASFPSYINDAFVGSRYWDIKSFSSNKYIQMSAFGSGGINKSYFIVPVDLTLANTMSFKSNMGFWNGAVLNVYYATATNYTVGSAIDISKMVKITSSFNIPTSPTSGYGTSFTSSGVYTIPTSVTGNGFFVFEYTGNAAASPAVTTTVQLDNITVN